MEAQKKDRHVRLFSASEIYFAATRYTDVIPAVQTKDDGELEASLWLDVVPWKQCSF